MNPMKIVIQIGSMMDLLALCFVLFFVLWIDITLIRRCWKSSSSDGMKVFWTSTIAAFPIAGGILYMVGTSISIPDSSTALAQEEAELKRRFNEECKR
jgi:Phospholipase_D-nuclease N-terminal